MSSDAANAIVAVSAFGALLVSIYNAWRMRHLEHSTNSKMDRLLELTAISSKAEGVKEEKERQR